jgi:hypothetical protein
LDWAARYRRDEFSPSFTPSIVDTLRVLSQAQTDISMVDVESLVASYWGPPEGIELLLSQYTNLGGTPDEHHRHMFAAIFQVVVKRFGGDCTQWESLVRKLIHQGVDVHGYVFVGSALGEGWGTLLDDLFIYTYTPLEASIVGNFWLRILASEGFDISTYLEEEISLYTALHLVPSPVLSGCRKLIFQLGETQSVSWEWHVEPESGALLVRDMFKSLIFTIDLNDLEFVRSVDCHRILWPWGHHVWYRYLYEYYMDPELRGLNFSRFGGWEFLQKSRQQTKLVDSRAARRMAKKAWKSRRAWRKKYPSQMPGAWPS